MNPAERFLAQILISFLRHTGSRLQQHQRLAIALSVEGTILGLDIPESPSNEENARVSRTFWTATRKALEARLSAAAPSSDDNLQLIEGLIELFGLSHSEAQIFRLHAWQIQSPQFEETYDALGIYQLMPRRVTNVSQIATLASIPDPSCRIALHPKSALFTSGLLAIDCDGDYGLSGNIRRVLNVERPGPGKLSECLIGDSLRSELTPTDYAHLGEDWQYLLRLVQGAIESRAAGVNILLHGDPGTGKTELCKVLAAAAGFPIYAAGRADESGREPSRSDRIAGLRSLQNLVGKRGQCLVLVDEAQDIFREQYEFLPSQQRSEGSRVFVHELLESMPVPVIWTANDIDSFGGPVLRRMSYVLELKTPPVQVRARIWKRSLVRHGIRHKNDDAHQLASDYTLAPALTSAAARSASIANGTIRDVRRVADNLGTVMGQPTRKAGGQAVAYDYQLATADMDLNQLRTKLHRSKGAPRFSMCLYGPPGTGKSAYARELVSALGLEVIQKRYSDLASKFVGDTEQAISAAFREAESAGAVLIFDEADSLLTDRSGAQRNWEVTQVNEMLTWMEAHPLPLVCTTNLMDRLDPASLRRFTFKVRMGYLSQEQLRLGFKRFFDVDAPAGLAHLSRITPGDLELVRRKSELLGCSGKANELLRLLQAEEAMKPGFQRPVGFSVY